MKKRVYKKTEKTCLTCNKKFLVHDYIKNTAKYCSKKCKHDKNAYWLMCEKCNKEFRRTEWQKSCYKGSYCSKKCYENRKDEIIVKCNGCGHNIRIYPSQQKYYKNHYCSNQCRINNGHVGRLTGNKIDSSRYQIFIRKVRHCKLYYEWRNKVHEKYENKCFECGSQNDLTVHHKTVSMYDFFNRHGFLVEKIRSDKQFTDVNNGQLLCRRCHAKKHIKK